MADNRIRFDISSTFNGEGFQKAAGAVRGVSGTVKSAADGVKNLSASFSQMGGQVSKVADGLGKVFSVFTAGGPAAIAVSAITLIVGAMVKWRGEIEESKRRHQELVDAMREGYERRVASYAQKAREATVALLDATVERAQRAIDRINQLAAAYKNLGAAEDAAARSAGGKEMAAIDYGVAIAGGGKDGRRLAQAQAAIEKEMLAYQDALRSATRAQSDANDAVGDLERKISQQSKVVEAMREAGKDETKEEQRLAAMNVELTAARHRLKAATDDLEAVNIRHATAEATLAEAQESLQNEIQDRQHAEAVAAREAQDKAKADAEARAELSRETEKRREQVAVLDRMIAEQERYIDAIKDAKETARKGMSADARHTSGSFGPYDYHTDENGNINDFEDFRRAERFAGRAERDQANTDRRNARLDAEAERLRNKDNLTDSEKKRLDSLDKFARQRQDLAAEEAKKKQLEGERDRQMKSLDDNVKQIKEDLKKAIGVQ